MEILSDVRFNGNVIISGGGFYVTYPGNISPVMETHGRGGILIRGTETIYGSLSLGDPSYNANIISNWSDLNNILDFAPSSLSTCIGCISTVVSSLCTAVSNLPKFCSITLPSDVPADCTKFTICAHGNHPVERAYYMFMTKGTNPMSLVNIDLEARCDSTTYNNWSFVATKSSGFEMKSSDGYVLKFFYHDC